MNRGMFTKIYDTIIETRDTFLNKITPKKSNSTVENSVAEKIPETVAPQETKPAPEISQVNDCGMFTKIFDTVIEARDAFGKMAKQTFDTIRDKITSKKSDSTVENSVAEKNPETVAPQETNPAPEIPQVNERGMFTKIFDTVIETRDAFWKTATQTCDTVWNKITSKKFDAPPEKSTETIAPQESPQVNKRGKFAEIWATIIKVLKMFWAKITFDNSVENVAPPETPQVNERGTFTKIYDTVIETRDAFWEKIAQTCDNLWDKIALKEVIKYGKNYTQETIDYVRKKLPSMNRGEVAEIWNKVTKMWEMFWSPNTSNYEKVAIIGALSYLVMPFDLIHDMLPFIGLSDDVAVLLFTARKILRLIAPQVDAFAVDIFNTAVIERAKVEIQKQLRIEFKEALTNTLIIFCLTLVAILILGFKPAGENISLWISSLLLLGVFIYSAIRVALSIRKIAVPLYHIITQKSLSAGLAEYLKRRFSELKIYESLVEFANQGIRSFVKLPPVKAVIAEVIPYLIKKVALFVAVFLGYTIGVHLILKPRLIEEMSGLGTVQFYSYPFIESFKFLFGG